MPVCYNRTYTLFYLLLHYVDLDSEFGSGQSFWLAKLDVNEWVNKNPEEETLFFLILFESNLNLIIVAFHSITAQREHLSELLIDTK